MLFIRYFSSRALFYSVLLTSLGMARASSRWGALWVSLELNILVFVPLLGGRGVASALENRLKYFLVQRVASVFFIWAALLSTFLGQELTAILIIFAMAVKLGMAPFHGWFVSVVSNTSFGLIFILSTVQKVIPLLVLSLLPARSFTVYILIFLTLLTVFLMGMGQVSIRKILVISSLNNVRWIFLGAQRSPTSWGLFLVVYSRLLGCLLMFLYFERMGSFSHSLLTGLKNSSKAGLILLLMSLGGLPPLLGFFNKLLIIKTIFAEEVLWVLLVIVFSSLFLLFYYIAWWFFLATTSPSQRKHQSRKRQPYGYLCIFVQGLFFIPVMFRIIYLYVGVGCTRDFDFLG